MSVCAAKCIFEIYSVKHQFNTSKTYRKVVLESSTIVRLKKTDVIKKKYYSYEVCTNAIDYVKLAQCVTLLYFSMYCSFKFGIDIDYIDLLVKCFFF